MDVVWPRHACFQQSRFFSCTILFTYEAIQRLFGKRKLRAKPKKQRQCLMKVILLMTLDSAECVIPLSVYLPVADWCIIRSAFYIYFANRNDNNTVPSMLWINLYCVQTFSSYRVVNSFSPSKTSQLLRYREIIAVYSEIHTKTHKCTVRGMQNLFMLNLVVYKVTTEL
jgi:hypothetical protein